MAGGRRRLETSHAPATSNGDASATSQQTSPPSTESTNTRVTRSVRGGRDAGASRGGLSRIRSGLSRIITLKTGRPRDRAAREAGTAQGQTTTPVASEHSESQNASLSPQTPRAKRSRRSAAVDDSPRSTRQSTRIKAQSSTLSNDLDEEDESKPMEASFHSTVSDSGTRGATQETVDASKNSPAGSNNTSPIPDNLNSVITEKPHQPDDTAVPAAESNAVEHTPKKSPSNVDHKVDQSTPVPSQDAVLNTRTTSLSGSRKRSSLELEDGDVDFANDSPLTKKAKFEDELDDASAQQLQNGDGVKTEGNSPVDGSGDSRLEDEPDLNLKEADTTPDAGDEVPTPKRRGGYRGRGRRRGRGRSRFVGRIVSNKRGSLRGRGGRGRGGRGGRPLNDVEGFGLQRSPSPSAEAQKLRERQRELDKAFKRVATAQRLALAELASQSEQRLYRDKNAHKAVPEYEEVSMLLKQRLREQQDILRNEYNLKVEQEMRLFAAEQERIHQSFRGTAQHVKEEHLLAAQGAYMSFVEGRRAAEDDEHTETDGSEADFEPGLIPKPAQVHVRGFSSSHVRAPAGAAAYELAREGWDDFVQRVKVGEDIDPEMRQMDYTRAAELSAMEGLDSLLRAGEVVEYDSAPNALNALADVAAARPPASMQRPLQQPQVGLEPSFMLPRPQPQPRRILPAGQQQIPPIREQLGLPDPFAGHGPPHLPPPPGSNFQRPPMPGFLSAPSAPSGPPPNIYYHSPHPPPPRPSYYGSGSR